MFGTMARNTEDNGKNSRTQKKVILAFVCLAIFIYLSNIHAACEFKSAQGAGECLPGTDAEITELKKFSLR
jgi:hypothetical protein